MLHCSRPYGRLFNCLVLVAVIFALSPSLRADPPNKTLISDVVYRADGTPASGTLLITWPAFTTADGKAVAAGTHSVKIGAGGQVSLSLVPNQGATPAGTYYQVVLKLDNGASSTEYWAVPALSPTTISAIRATVVPAVVATQTVSREYVDAEIAKSVHRSGDEAIAGIKEFAASPLVPDPSAATAAANKQYVDAAVSGTPNNVLALDKGGTGNSQWTPARCVQVAADGSRLEAAGGECSSGNADTLDGLHASAFAPVVHNQSAATITSGTLDAARIPAALNAITPKKVGGMPLSDQYAGVDAALSDAGAQGAVIVPPGSNAVPNYATWPSRIGLFNLSGLKWNGLVGRRSVFNLSSRWTDSPDAYPNSYSNLGTLFWVVGGGQNVLNGKHTYNGTDDQCFMQGSGEFICHNIALSSTGNGDRFGLLVEHKPKGIDITEGDEGAKAAKLSLRQRGSEIDANIAINSHTNNGDGTSSLAVSGQSNNGIGDGDGLLLVIKTAAGGRTVSATGAILSLPGYPTMPPAAQLDTQMSDEMFGIANAGGLCFRSDADTTSNGELWFKVRSAADKTHITLETRTHGADSYYPGKFGASATTYKLAYCSTIATSGLVVAGIIKTVNGYTGWQAGDVAMAPLGWYLDMQVLHLVFNKSVASAGDADVITASGSAFAHSLLHASDGQYETLLDINSKFCAAYSSACVNAGSVMEVHQQGPLNGFMFDTPFDHYFSALQFSDTTGSTLARYNPESKGDAGFTFYHTAYPGNGVTLDTFTGTITGTGFRTAAQGSHHPALTGTLQLSGPYDSIKARDKDNAADLNWLSQNATTNVLNVGDSYGISLSGPILTSNSVLVSNLNADMLDGQHAASFAADSAVVHNSGNETIAGSKTFSSTISGSISGNAATASALASKVDFLDNTNILKATLCNANQLLKKAADNLSWTCAADATGGGGAGTWGSITGTLSDQTDLQTALNAKAADSAVVHNTGNETIAGSKTFSSTISGSISGNAGTASALAADGANCNAGNAPLGVDASGAAEGCFAVLTPSSTLDASKLSGTVPAASMPAPSASTLGGVKAHDCGTQFVKTIGTDGSITCAPPSGSGGTLLNYQKAVAAVTGVGSSQPLYSYNIPGGTMPAGGCVEAEAMVAHTQGSASTTYAWVYAGVTATAANSVTASATYNFFRATICNDPSVTNAQQINVALVATGTSLRAGQVVTAAADSTAQQALSFNSNTAATDQDTPKWFMVRKVAP